MTHISQALAVQSNSTDRTTRIEIIWGSRLLAEGFTAIPNILLRNYHKLGIDHNEWGLLCTLLSYKHDERDPYPEQETLAQNLSLSVRQIRNLTHSLQLKKILSVGRRRNQRTGTYGSLVYNLSPLMDKLNKLLELENNQLDTTVSKPAEVLFPLDRPEPPEVLFPVKRITSKDKDTTTTTTKNTRARTGSNIWVKRQNSYTKENIVQRVQAKIATHLPQHKSTDVTSDTFHVTTDSVSSESLSHSVHDWSVSSSSQNHQSHHYTEQRVQSQDIRLTRVPRIHVSS